MGQDCFVFSKLDELSGGGEGGASREAPDDVPSFGAVGVGCPEFNFAHAGNSPGNRWGEFAVIAFWNYSKIEITTAAIGNRYECLRIATKVSVGQSCGYAVV